MDHTLRERPANPLAIEILLKEYDQRRDEIVSVYQRYDKQGQTLTVYVTIVAILTLALLAVELPGTSIEVPGLSLKLPPRMREHASAFSLIALTSGVLIAFYFISNLME